MTFRRATKQQSKLRLAVFGPSGAGKTFTSLRIANGLGGRVAVIDTERGSASKYADRFSFDVAELDGKKDIDTVIATLRDASRAGYDVIVIDSLSHAWQELLAEVDNIARARYKGNTWSAWSEGTPKQRRLVDAILSYPGHVIGTMRSKTEWTTESGTDGRNRPVRVGLAPEQGKGIEYEFDLLVELSPDHVANIIKDRTGRFQDVLIEKPGEDFGRELAAWLADETPAVVPSPSPKGISRDAATRLQKKLTGMGLGQDIQAQLASTIAGRSVGPFTELSQDEATRVFEAASEIAEGKASLADFAQNVKRAA